MKSLQAIFKRFIRNECTRQEIDELLALFADAGNELELRRIILEQLKDGENLVIEELSHLSEKEDLIYAALLPHLQTQRPVLLWLRMAAVAASILIMLSVGGYFYFNKTQPLQVAAIKPGMFKNDVLPGSNNAILTLSNGQQIDLENVKDGLVAKQGNTAIRKKTDGVLTYKASHTEAAVVYNTIVTKRAGKYNVTLPDGTVAYLDAASSIHFPTAFHGSDRQVTITGQVYFEVAHDKSKPFRVKARDQLVEVLGTHFNINAYEDEPVMKTTLLKGRIRVSRNTDMELLVPGQQAQIKMGAPILITDKVDLEEVIAWKNGLFKLNNTELPAVIRQLNRWYDVEVEYRGPEKVYHFGGYMARSSNLTSTLKILQLSGVKFSIDGKKLIVYR